MLNAASKDDLIELINELKGNDMSVRRICINHLKEKVTISSSVNTDSESSAAMTLWYEIEPELSELDYDMGGDYSRMEEFIGSLQSIFLSALQNTHVFICHF